MSLMSVRNPRETVVRKVYVYPASGDDPYVTSMEFSEAGADHRHGFYTTAVDLRPSYGKYLRDGIRHQRFDVENQPDKSLEGEYIVYYNLDLRLPLNLAMARVVGMNPKRPGSRPTWRGDVVVVKHQDWPGPLVFGGGLHMDWLDIDPAIQGSLERLFRHWYASEVWETKIETERKDNEHFRQPQSEVREIMKMLNDKSADDPKEIEKLEKQKRMLDKLQKQRDKQIVREAAWKCATCSSLGNPNLMACSRCREVKYCSKECQTVDWKRHKGDCRKKN